MSEEEEEIERKNHARFYNQGKKDGRKELQEELLRLLGVYDCIDDEEG